MLNISDSFLKRSLSPNSGWGTDHNLLALSKASDIFYCPSCPLSITSCLKCGYILQSLSFEGYSPSLLSSLTPSKHVSLDCIMPGICDISFPSTNRSLQTLFWLHALSIAFDPTKKTKKTQKTPKTPKKPHTHTHTHTQNQKPKPPKPPN